MANFFTENADIVFRFEHLDLDEIVALREGDFREHESCPYAPADAQEAVENYRRVLALVGELAAERIAPRATDVDREGARLRDDGVQYAAGTRENLKELAEADLMGFTLPRRYGGLNMPTVTYCIANELVSRADASLMNLFGLQDIAETIHAFGSEEQKDTYLPKFAAGEVTGAMVLTEPDAGSDLQAVRTKGVAAEPVETDGPWNWRLNGVKRFITNGCGDVLLVLARSEPGTKDGRGLSLFICEKGPWVHVRRIEDKLGIHGSPTCELVFKDAPAQLIGQRRRGLSKYVMALMNGARVGIAAQALGIAEAAYRDALAFAEARVQFGKKILDMPPVTEILLGMKMNIEGGRVLLYETGRIVDLADGLERKADAMDRTDPARREIAARATLLRKRANALTPMAKYWLCEMANWVASQAIQVHGGSGYMRDYDVERYFRDARITSIYEGTTELQVVAIRAALLGGALDGLFDDLEAQTHPDDVADLVEMAREGRQRLVRALAYVREKKDPAYTEWAGRALADIACDVLLGWYFLRDARWSDAKKTLARKFVTEMALRCEQNERRVLSGQDITIRRGRDLLAPDIPEA